MKRVSLILMLMVWLFLFTLPGFSQSEKPKIAPICKQCHTPDEKVLRGTFVNVSQKVIS